MGTYTPQFMVVLAFARGKLYKWCLLNLHFLSMVSANQKERLNSPESEPLLSSSIQSSVRVHSRGCSTLHLLLCTLQLCMGADGRRAGLVITRFLARAATLQLWG